MYVPKKKKAAEEFRFCCVQKNWPLRRLYEVPKEKNFASAASKTVGDDEDEKDNVVANTN